MTLLNLSFNAKLEYIAYFYQKPKITQHSVFFCANIVKAGGRREIKLT